MIIIVCAMTKGRHVIGKDNTLPWDIPEEMQHFRSLTKDSTVIMGRKTFESIDSKPLPKRNNIVISSTLEEKEGIYIFPMLKEGIEKAKEFGKEIFILGGHGIFKEGLQFADKMYLSFIKKEYDGDVLFPEFDEGEWEIEKRENHEEFEFVVYSRKK